MFHHINEYLILYIYLHWTCLYLYGQSRSFHSTSLPSFLSFPLLTCCAILPTSFEAMIGRTAFIDRLLAEVFRDFLSCEANASRSVHSPQYHLTITLSFADRRDWRDTRGKYPVRSWWHLHISLKLSWPQSMGPRTHYKRCKIILQSAFAFIKTLSAGLVCF